MICHECGAVINSEVQRIFDSITPKDRTIELYCDVAGQDVFTVYAQSGGISMKQVYYLVRLLKGCPAYVLAVWVTEDLEKRMRSALEWFDNKCRRVDMNGGDMGLPES